MLNYKKYLKITRLCIFKASLLKLNKKIIALTCFIEITSILPHPKTQLNQAVKPYSINVVKGRSFLRNGLHYFNEREQDRTSRYKRVYHSALQAMKHGSREQH